MNLTTSPLWLRTAIYLVIFGTVRFSFSQQWIKTAAPGTNWSCLASSADGLKVAAGRSDGGLYLSTNGGLDWAESSAPALGWSDVTSSADGNVLVGFDGGSIYISRDAGATWSLSNAQGGTAVACSSDGMKIYVTAWFGIIRRSLDMGTNWSDTHSPNPGWVGIASSADGERVIAAASNSGQVYRSTNSGLDWEATALPNNNWQKVVSSADGSRLIAVNSDQTWGTGQFYVSTNAANTWDLISATSPYTGTYWGGVASSADGTVLAAAKTGAYGYPGGSIFVSWNSGAFWTKTYAPFVDWTRLICSADGTRLLATTAGGVYSLDIGISVTLPARGTNGTAVFQAVLNPGGNETTAWFEWGPTPAHGNTTSPQVVGDGGVMMFNGLAIGLDIGTDYYFRIVATNSNGTFVGEDRIYHAPLIQLPDPSIVMDFDFFFQLPTPTPGPSGDDIVYVDGSVDTGTPGVYTLTYFTTNSLGIVGVTNLTVTIRGPRGIAADSLTNLVALRATFLDARAKPLDMAIAKLTRANAPDLWIDETHLAYPEGREVFNDSANVVSGLITLARRGSMPPLDAENWSYRLVHSMRLLAVMEMDMAAQARTEQTQLLLFIKQLKAGDAASECGKLIEAIGHYQSAWKVAARFLARSR